MEFGLSSDQWELYNIEYITREYKHKTFPILIELEFEDSADEMTGWSVELHHICIHIGPEKELDHKLIEFICERHEWIFDNLTYDDSEWYPRCLLCGNDTTVRAHQSVSHFYECHNTVTKSASKQ